MPDTRFVFTALALAASALVARAQPAGGQERPVFRTGVKMVSIYATVRDREGRFAPDLTRDEFELRIDGRPQEISVFSADSQPITVCLLLDMSGSVTHRLLRLRDGSLHFIKALTPVDRARVGTFGAEIFISPLLTNDHNVLERVLREELWPGGQTPLWGAMGAAVDSLAAEPGRRVILVLSDGVDNGTLPGYPVGFGGVADRVIEGGFLVYSVGVGIRGMTNGQPLDKDLAYLVTVSGGARFHLADDADLKETFTRVADELRRQYLIGFVPEARLEGRQRIDLRVKRPGHRVQARREFTVGGHE
jgi:Ca-activated chloride channel family protein